MEQDLIKLATEILKKAALNEEAKILYLKMKNFTVHSKKRQIATLVARH